ncbi:hydrogenase iron-sulfur subunit [Thermodesulfobacteriota bacterium]
MSNEQKRTLALFYCRNVPESGEYNRRTLEKRYGLSIRLFPIPCSGRLEILHLLRALEEFADAAYVITCPEGACRYFEGNRRAKKRVERARSIIESIGLEKERLGIIIGSEKERKTLAELSDEILETLSCMAISPVHEKRLKA